MPFDALASPLLTFPERDRLPGHGDRREVVPPFFHICFPVSVIRIAVSLDFHMSPNRDFGRVENGLLFAISEYPVVSGDTGEVFFLDPFPALLRMSSA